LALVTVTVKVPAVDTLIEDVVAPVDHKYVLYPEPAFNIVELPEQNVVVPLMDGVGLEITVVVALVLPVHPLALVTVTVKVPAVDTLIEDVVAPVDHRYVLYPEPAFNIVELPKQNVVVPLMDGVGLELTVVVALVLPVHPLALVTVTVKAPAVDTLIEDVVAPVDHRYVLYPEPAFNVVELPEQNVVAPLMDGVGLELTVMLLLLLLPITEGLELITRTLYPAPVAVPKGI